MASNKTGQDTDKVWTEEERLKLATKLDDELDDFINNLEKKSYTEGWPEDRWQAEMEKHPFFMKKAPEPGEELHPLMEGLQQLKYDESENTPEALALSYKEDGNFNYKCKKYRLAILGYTEGIRTKCTDKDLLAQLYNNRAAAQFILQNYRSCLNDCKEALKVKAKYPKAMNRAAMSCFKIKDYDQCIRYCDEILEEASDDKEIINLKLKATREKKCLQRDARMKDICEKKSEKEEELILDIIRSRNIKLYSHDEKMNLSLNNLEPKIPHIAQNRVHTDSKNRLIWPVMILYPEMLQTDFIQNFHEDTIISDQLEELYEEPPHWDMEKRYVLGALNVYFEDCKKSHVYKVNLKQTLGEVLSHEKFTVRGGTPSFIILVAGSETEKRFLQNFS